MSEASDRGGTEMEKNKRFMALQTCSDEANGKQKLYSNSRNFQACENIFFLLKPESHPLNCMASLHEKKRETRHLFLVTLFRLPFLPSMRLVFRSFNQGQCFARLITQAELKGQDITQRTIIHRPFCTSYP